MKKNLQHIVKRNNKGYILTCTILIISVFLILSSALLLFLRNEIVAYQKTEASIKAEYLALGGVQAYLKLKKDTTLFPVDGDNSTKITVTISSGLNTAVATGIINEGNKQETKFIIRIEDGRIISNK